MFHVTNRNVLTAYFWLISGAKSYFPGNREYLQINCQTLAFCDDTKRPYRVMDCLEMISQTRWWEWYRHSLNELTSKCYFATKIIEWNYGPMERHLCWLIRRLNIINMALFPQLTYHFYKSLSKCRLFFCKTWQGDPPNHMHFLGTQKSQNDLERTILKDSYFPISNF